MYLFVHIFLARF